MRNYRSGLEEKESFQWEKMSSWRLVTNILSSLEKVTYCNWLYFSYRTFVGECYLADESRIEILLLKIVMTHMQHFTIGLYLGTWQFFSKSSFSTYVYTILYVLVRHCQNYFCFFDTLKNEGDMPVFVFTKMSPEIQSKSANFCDPDKHWSILVMNSWIFHKFRSFKYSVLVFQYHLRLFNVICMSIVKLQLQSATSNLSLKF